MADIQFTLMGEPLDGCIGVKNLSEDPVDIFSPAGVHAILRQYESVIAPRESELRIGTKRMTLSKIFPDAGVTVAKT